MKGLAQNRVIRSFVMVGIALIPSILSAQNTPSQETPSISYSELIKNKESYLGKTVRLKATWIYGFEWTYLCESVCGNLPKAWVEVEYDRALKKCSTPKLGEAFNNGAQVIVLGKLEEATGQRRYGHMGAYDLKFVITCVEKFKKIF